MTTLSVDLIFRKWIKMNKHQRHNSISFEGRAIEFNRFCLFVDAIYVLETLN